MYLKMDVSIVKQLLSVQPIQKSIGKCAYTKKLCKCENGKN